MLKFVSSAVIDRRYSVQLFKGSFEKSFSPKGAGRQRDGRFLSFLWLDDGNDYRFNEN